VAKLWVLFLTRCTFGNYKSMVPKINKSNDVNVTSGVKSVWNLGGAEAQVYTWTLIMILNYSSKIISLGGALETLKRA